MSIDGYKVYQIKEELSIEDYYEIFDGESYVKTRDKYKNKRKEIICRCGRLSYWYTTSDSFCNKCLQEELMREKI